MKLELKKFNMSSIGNDKVVVMIAKRGSGKSFLVKDLMYHHSDIPVGTVISPTEAANKFFSDFVPPVFIHEEYKSSVVANYVKRQKMITQRINQEKALYGRSSIDPRAFLILDDCLYDGSWTKDINIRYLFMNGRHVCAGPFIITMQYPLGIPPNLRTNIDYVFLLREPVVSNRRRLYEQYAGMFPSFDIFCQVFSQTTENYECLVIDNTSKSNKIEDMVYWYRAEDRPSFRIGMDAFWQAGAGGGSHIDGLEEDEDVYDPSTIMKNKHVINVRKSY